MSVYRILLLLYPAAFRGQYGEELCAVFARRLRDAANPLALLLVWMDAVLDVLITASQTHWDILRQDIRYTLRSWRRAPGFAVTAIVVAALGVGATTAAYTLTDYVLLRPLPFPEADRLTDVWEDTGPYTQMEPSPPNYRDWKLMNKSFSAMAAYTDFLFNLVGAGQPEQVQVVAATSDLFPMLGAQTELGRLPTPQDDRDGAPGVVVLSNGFWKQRFGGDSGVLGRKILLNDQPYVIVGVMQAGFLYPRRSTKLWTAMRFANRDFEDRNDNILDVVAKLRPGISIAQARADMRIVSARLKQQYPVDNEHVGVTVNSLRDEMPDRSRMLLMALLGASFCVLLIACSNLANLLLARALARRKEIAVRNALGAGRERLVRQMMTESLALALCGGFLGLLLAALAVPLFSKLVPDALPIAAQPSIDGRVLLFAFALTILTGICFGVIPAARGASGNTAASLQEGSRQGVGGRKERLRSGLVIAEVAVSLVLLVCSGLLIRALLRVEQTNPGFQPENVLTVRTMLPMPRYSATATRVQFYSRVLSEVRRLPGVSSAGYTSFLPIVATGGIWPVTIAGQPKNVDRAQHSASLRYVTPGYLETLRIPLLRGRGVSESDSGKSQYVALVSESFVREYWPHDDPLGRQFDFGLAMRTVVGVVGNIKVRGFERSSEPQVYLPYRQVPDETLTYYAPKDLAIRSNTASETLLPSVRRIIAESDPQLPVSDVQTLGHIVEEQTASRLTQVRVLGAFAMVAILLAGIGIHGLLSFTVSNRSQEIGVRIAMGARSADIVRMVLRETALLVIGGALVGLLLAYGAGRTLESLLAGVHPADLLTYAAGLVLLLGMSLAGSFLPALRAVRVDPMVAMRAE